ncbi:MAG: carboxypeptidase regulatory-like domain-containing protein, partial [Candidatus Thorarchaeota archaeon]
GPLEVSVTGLDLSSLGIPEVGDFIADGGAYRMAIDYISGALPLDYVITAEVDGIVVGQIDGSINPEEDYIVSGWHDFESWAVEDFEELQFNEGDHVTLTLEFESQGSLEPDLDLACWASHESGFWRVEEATLVQRSIAGTVINENSNEPIPDAELTLRDAVTEDIVATTMTDSNGLYKFSNLVVGDYWIELNTGICFSVTGSYRQRATIGDVVNFALHPRNFELELSGSFDYLLKEEIHFQFAGQLKDIDTGVPISGAYVEFDLYGPDGLLILSDAMVEQSPGTYVYTSADTLKDLKWEKGIYLVICDAAIIAGAETCATAMIQFHIDPPGEPDLMTSSVLPSIGAVSIISVAGIGGLFRRRRRLRNRSP